jgi:hypothetical protein
VAGIATTLFWIPERDLGRGYFQLNALILLGLLALMVAVVVLHPIDPYPAGSVGMVWLWTAVGAALVYYGLVWLERWSWVRLPAAALLVAALLALVEAGAFLVVPRTPLPHRYLLLLANLSGSALLLGWSLITMLLGHWYLISPKLSFRHLIRFCRILTAVVILRAALVGMSLLATRAVDPFVLPHPQVLLLDFGGQGMFFWFRVLWGLVIPLLLALMALHCARNHSNQSATGILYVLLVGSFIGEITALYLAVTTGVPL